MGTAQALSRPNVLFIAMDDLNDWVGCLGGHPQAKTPNLDRLAKSGILFTNAHCAAPSCNPSRTAILTGISPATSGLYTNLQPMREVLPDAKLLPAVLRESGYTALGSGKLLHYFTDARSWDRYFPEASTENPLPETLYPAKRPVSLPRAGEWQYIETDWGALDTTDEAFGGDYSVSTWVGEQLRQKHDKPLFLACGLYRPHEPWFVPKKYFEPFPLDKIQLPPGYKADDLDDLPAEGKRRGPNRYFEHIQKQNQWKQGVQGYLAAIYFADTMLGRVLDALEKSPERDNTIVVLWSDHGWHLGEKQHWQKYTAWRACTRVPLIIRVPKNTVGLPAGTKPARCDKPVSLLSLAPTLLDLCGLPAFPVHEGPSLLPLLKNPKVSWKPAAVTYLDTPGSYGLSAQGWRYIHYADGGEELYDISKDPHEWTNLASQPRHAAKLAELRALAPTRFAPAWKPSATVTADLAWHPVSAGDILPVSKPQGTPATVAFLNQTELAVRVWWISPTGEHQRYAELKPGTSYSSNIRKGAIWLITDTNDKPLGYFLATGTPSRALIKEPK
ncbi:sulfatase-like hydrolase/transferase [Armatimonas sp.]|uniref:sulfatase-like hydrolase/transferase n=1 Tax=Armatimonas sp. TaxID=1872638 RepID=UPI0034D983EB